MEEIGKRRLAVGGAVLALLVYFLVCAFPLQKELVLVPAWSKSVSAALNQSPAKPADSAGKDMPETIPFQLGQRYGYFTPQGDILLAADADYGIALSPSAYATYDRQSDGFSIKSPWGGELSKVSLVGYPFFAAGRRFVLGPDQSTVCELDEKGGAKWSFQLPAIVTAFDASPSLVAFGLIDGTIIGLDSGGKEVLSFAPGGSRVVGVYGVAVSPDGHYVAAMTGADRQRFILLEKRSSAYRVCYHRYLSSDYRRPVYIAFTSDGSRVAYESPAGIAIYDRRSGDEYIVSVPATARLGQTTRAGKLMVFLSGSGQNQRLVCTALPDRRVVDISLKASLAFVEARGDSLYLGADDSIVRMNFEER